MDTALGAGGREPPMRIAYLGPSGHVHRGCLRAALGDTDGVELVPEADGLRHDPGGRLRRGVERALVPFENSIEGAVRSTLDTLAFDTPWVDDRRRARLSDPQQPDRARELPLDEITAVLSHPQASAQCARFIRERCRRRRCGPRRAPPRPCGRWPPASEAVGRARRELGRGHLRLRGACRGGGGRPRQRDAVRVDRAGRHATRRARGRGGRLWSSPSSARTSRARWSRRCSSSR